MIEIPSPGQMPPELSGPSLPQAIKFFSPRQKKILIISSIAFLIVLTASSAAFYFWLTSFKKSLVDFSIAGPTQVASGDPATFTISYWNNTNQILENASLVIRYPQDSEVSGGKLIQTFDLGNIGIGGGGKQDVTLAFIGADKSIEQLNASLSYKPQNTTSSFKNDALQQVAISGSALGIDFKTPETVLPNTRNNFTIHYKNNTDKVFRNVAVEITYPSSFNFISSDKAPSQDNNTWNLGDLNPNEEGDIIISGILRDSQNVNFDITIGVTDNGQFYKFIKTTAQINLTALPLKLDITANDKTEFTVFPSDFLQFKLHYQNDAGVPLSDVVLKVKLDGLMYDFGSLRTDGYYNGADNTITWNGGNTPQFKSLEASASGDATFQIKVKSRYVIRTFRDKNFLLQVSGVMSTPTVPPSLAMKELSVTSVLAIKVGTQAEIKTKGYYYDSVIRNSGPLPPKVNQTTTYTVHWQITNYSNDLNNVVVKAVLPQGVVWLNKKAGAGAATLEYNDRTSELTWNVGKIPAATGVLLDPYEAVFQLAVTPSVINAGSVMNVLGDSSLTATDLFTSNDVIATVPILTTNMPDDLSVGILKGRVQP